MLALEPLTLYNYIPIKFHSISIILIHIIIIQSNQSHFLLLPDLIALFFFSLSFIIIFCLDFNFLLPLVFLFVFWTIFFFFLWYFLGSIHYELSLDSLIVSLLEIIRFVKTGAILIDELVTGVNSFVSPLSFYCKSIHYLIYSFY